MQLDISNSESKIDGLLIKIQISSFFFFDISLLLPLKIEKDLKEHITLQVHRLVIQHFPNLIHLKVRHLVESWQLNQEQNNKFFRKEKEDI